MPENSIELIDNALVRRYFVKLDTILTHLKTIAGTGLPGADLGAFESTIVSDYLDRLDDTITALAMKYRLTGLARNVLPHELEIDVTDSGLPMFREIIELEQDLEGAKEELAAILPTSELKQNMVDHILTERAVPRGIQYEIARRHYLEFLSRRTPFLTHNAPEFEMAKSKGWGRRRYLVYWAVYDTQRNVPNFYFMVVEDTASDPLHNSKTVKKAFGETLLKQSLSTLKLVTIAQGVDKDFPKLHPIFLRRVHAGPLYSNNFTRHSDSIQKVLADHTADPEEDWIFAWTVETLASKDSRAVSSGMFSTERREVYHIDHKNPVALDAGATEIDQFMVLPMAAYQSLLESDEAGLQRVDKYVVGPDGQIIHRA